MTVKTYETIGEKLYTFVSEEGEERITTELYRLSDGSLSLSCRREENGAADSVILKELCHEEEFCLEFARTVAESHTDPRVLLELWEEYIS